MNIVALVGVQVAECSNTHKNVIKLTDEIRRHSNEEVNIDIISGKNFSINNCIGCLNCFKKHLCPLDIKDNFDSVKEKLLKADIIIMASPVFFHQVSGLMKTYLDRLSYWAHLFRLAGSIGVPISVSSTNGNEFVDLYLNKVLEYFGCATIKGLSLTIDDQTEEEINEAIIATSERLLKVYGDRYEVRTSKMQEIMFHTFRQQYAIMNEGIEREYWINNNMFTYSSFESYWKVKLSLKERFLNEEITV